jgi:hypothetical protein
MAKKSPGPKFDGPAPPVPDDLLGRELRTEPFFQTISRGAQRMAYELCHLIDRMELEPAELRTLADKLGAVAARKRRLTEAE